MRPLDGLYLVNRFLRSPLPPGAAGFTHPKTNTVQVWFNLAACIVDTHIAGATILLYSAKAIDAFGGGWYRCAVEVTSPTITVITASRASAAADNTASANGNSIAAGRAQLEADAALTNQTSYIPTTTATVTGSAENIHLPIDPAWFNSVEGTLIYEFVNHYVPNGLPGSHAAGGVANSFNDVIYLSRTGTSTMQALFSAGGVTAAQLTRGTCQRL